MCDLEIIPIEKGRQCAVKRKIRESMYINKFDSVLIGFNVPK